MNDFSYIYCHNIAWIHWAKKSAKISKNQTSLHDVDKKVFLGIKNLTIPVDHLVGTSAVIISPGPVVVSIPVTIKSK